VPARAPDTAGATLEASAPVPTLASRGDRFLAVIVDSFVGLVVGVPVAIYSGYANVVFEGRTPTPAVYAETFAVCWGWFLLVNGYWLVRNGQTVGKRFLDIRICDYRTAAVPPVWRILVRIFAPGSLVYWAL